MFTTTILALSLAFTPVDKTCGMKGCVCKAGPCVTATKTTKGCCKNGKCTKPVASKTCCKNGTCCNGGTCCKPAKDAMACCKVTKPTPGMKLTKKACCGNSACCKA